MTVPLVAASGVMLSTAGDFESSMNRVRAVSGATGDQFSQLRGLAQQLGASTQYSASQAADAMGYLAMAGFDANDILTALPGTLDLAAAGQLDLADAADIASNILTGYGFAASDLTRVNDVLAKTFTSSNVNMRMLGDSFKYIGPVAKSAGLQFEEVSAAVGLLGNAGIQGEQAGTVLRGAISRLLKPTGAVKDTLDELGVSVADSTGQMLPLVDIIGQLEHSGASTADMLTIFGLEAGPGMSALLEQGSGALSDLTTELEGAGGTAQDIADIQMQGLNGALAELKSALEGLLIAIGDSGMLEQATDRVKWLTVGLQDLAHTNPELLSTATTIGMVVAAIGPMVWVGGKVVTTVGLLTTGINRTAGAAAAAATTLGNFRRGWTNINTAMATGAPLATRLSAAIRSQTLLWNQQATAQGRSVLGMKAYNTWVKIVRGTTLAWTAAQWALNVAWNAHPVGLIITGLVLLGVAIYEAYQHCEWFRDGLNAMGAAIMSVLQPVVWACQVTWDAIVAGWDWVVDASSAAWDALVDGWDALVGVFTDPPSFSEIVTALQDAGAQAADWLKARGDDLVAWAGDLPARFYDAMVDLGQGLMDLLAGILDLDNLTRIGQDIAGWLTGLGDDIIAWATELPGRVGPRVSEIGDAALEWLKELPGKAHEHLTGFAQSIVDRVKSIPGKISEAIDTGAIVEWVDGLKDKALEKLRGLADSAVEWAKELPAKLSSAVDNAANIVDWLAEWGPKILAGLGIAVAVVVAGIPALLLGVAAAVLYVLGVIVFELGKWLTEKFTGLMSLVGQAISSKVSEVGSKFAELRDDMVQTAVDLKNRVVGLFTGLRDDAISRVQGMRDQVVQRAVSLRDRAVSTYADLRNKTVSIFTAVRDKPAQLVATLRDWVAQRASSLRDRTVKVFEDFRAKSIRAFERAQQGIKTAWDKIRSATKKPVQFVVDTVYNNGIRAVWNKVAGLVKMDKLSRMAFADGGTLPGYTPGKDVHRFFSPTGGILDLSGGESVMRPEFTAAVGPGWVNAINSAARSGGTAGVRNALSGMVPHQAFANGGILDRIGSFARAATDGFTGGLKKTAKAALDPLVGETLAAIGGGRMGRFGDAVAKLPKSMISGLTSWLGKVIEPKLGGDFGSMIKLAKSKVGNFGGSDYSNEFTRAFGMNGLPWCAMFVSKIIKDAKVADRYNNIWSAAVASFNGGMKHVPLSERRTGDLATYRGNGHINIVVDRNTTVGGNESNAVRINKGYVNSATAILRPKAMATGGIIDWKDFLLQDRADNTAATTPLLTQALRASIGVPTLYDDGGWLPPGLNLVANATGGPEPVLTREQWADIRADRNREPAAREGHTFHITETRAPRSTARQVVTALRDYEALHPTVR
nr:phage tail tape measure protein [Nocardiopsis mwathae]